MKPFFRRQILIMRETYQYIQMSKIYLLFTKCEPCCVLYPILQHTHTHICTKLPTKEYIKHVTNLCRFIVKWTISCWIHLCMIYILHAWIFFNTRIINLSKLEYRLSSYWNNLIIYTPFGIPILYNKIL